jgi:hypothetical protein
MLPSAPVPGIRQILENHVSEASTELEALLADTRRRDRSQLAGQLNQAVRRIRLATDLDEMAAALLDASAGFATGAALLRASAAIAHGVRIRGVSGPAVRRFAGMEIPLASAAALAGAIETRDPVSAVTSVAEVSEQLVEIAGHAAGDRAWIFPLAAGERVPALLYCWGTVEIAALELLAQAAAPAWMALDAPPKTAAAAAAAGLVQLGAPTAPGSAWDNLAPEEQKIHLRAQRFARVEAAEMRLRQAEVVQAARAQRDLYRALRTSIDAAREKFQRTYFAACPTMVDYLHLELVRTLANDDAELLGQDYPGPLV